MRLIIVAGGTGGHIYPAVAIAREIMKQVRITHYNKECKLLFVGNRNGMEKKIIEDSGYEFRGITASGIKGKSFMRGIIGLFKITKGCMETINIFLSFRPNLVLGMGSYVSVPVIVISIVFGIPLLLHEQNSIPGLVNKIFVRFAKRVFLSFEETKKYLSAKFSDSKERGYIVTGDPIREEFITVSRESALQHLGISDNKTTLLFIGGSQGAHSINTATKEFIDIIKERKIPEMQIIWITGSKDFELMCRSSQRLENVGSRLIICPFMKNVWDAYCVSNLVIARSGATTVAEITSIGVPSILIPFPKAIYDHQTKNASVLFENRASVVLCDDGLSGDVLFKTIFGLMENKELLRVMGENAKGLSKADSAKIIAREILKFV